MGKVTVSMAQAAARIGRSRYTVYRLIKSGRLDVLRCGCSARVVLNEKFDRERSRGDRSIVILNPDGLRRLCDWQLSRCHRGDIPEE